MAMTWEEIAGARMREINRLRSVVRRLNAKSSIVVCVKDGIVQEVYADLSESMDVEVWVMDDDMQESCPNESDAAVYEKCKALLNADGMRCIYG